MKEHLKKIRNNPLYIALMMILAIIAIALLFAELTVYKDTIFLNNIKVIDNMIISIFALDYFLGLYLSEDKKKYFKNNILELISIIPFGLLFQSARILLIFRLFRVLVFFKSALEHLRKILKANGLLYVIIFTIILILSTSYFAYFFEHKVNDGFGSYGDALWWAIVTAGTVGYGDISPITTEGRFVASFLIILGVGFIGLLSASMAAYFMNSDEGEHIHDSTLKLIMNKLNRIDKLSEEELKELNDLTEYLWKKKRAK